MTRWELSFYNLSSPLEKDVWLKASCAGGLDGR